MLYCIVLYIVLVMESSYWIIVKNLSRNVGKVDLEEIFGHFGQVVAIEMGERLVQLPDDKKIAVKKAYAFIEYKDSKDGKKAIEYMDKAVIDGLRVYVQKKI